MLKIDAGTEATLANLNVRTEKHGKETLRPAADIKVTLDIPNTQLDQIHPGLLASLYRRENESGHQGDLTATDPGTLTTPRYPKARPWASTEDWPGYKISLVAGTFDVDPVELDRVTLKGITVQPRNGGTVSLSFSIGANPTGEQIGVLYEAMGQPVAIALEPPSLRELNEARADAAKPAKDPKPEPNDRPIADAEAGRAFGDAIDGRRSGIH